MMASLSLALLVLAALMTVVVAALPGPQWRKPICLLGALSSGAYIAWRWHSVANVDLAPPGQHGWVVFCFVVEAALVAEYWLFLLLCSRHRNRRGEADAHEARGDTPRVDVFIATRDEEAAILEKSILGALAMDYPDFTLHVLDDGRRDWLAELCAELGVHYVTRPDNSHKKAGNHNHALGLTDAPFIAVFDADFVPFRNFLRRTIGFFAEPAVGIVQTPQYFYNQDSVFGLDLVCTARRRLGDGWGVELAPSPEQRRALIRALFTRPWSPTSPRLPAGAALATMLWRFVGGS